MTLRESATAPFGFIYFVVVILAIMSIILLTGKGAFLIAGYNTASKEEQEKYDAKKISQIVGIGMAVISLLLLVMVLLADVLPISFAYVFLGIVIFDAVSMIVLVNTKGKKK